MTPHSPLNVSQQLMRWPHPLLNILRQFERWLSLTSQFTVIIRDVTLTHHSIYCNNSRCNSYSPLIELQQLERWLSLTTQCTATSREVNLTHHSKYCGNSRVNWQVKVPQYLAVNFDFYSSFHSSHWAVSNLIPRLL